MSRKRNTRRTRSRKRRARKKSAKRRKGQQRKSRSDGIQLPAGFSTPVIKHFSFDNPFAHLTDQQKREFAAAYGDRARRNFERGIQELGSALKSHDPIELLSTAAFYCLFKGVGPKTDFTDEGPYPQALVEVMQSICLRFTLDQFDCRPVLHGHLSSILNLCRQCSEDFGAKRFTSFVEIDTGNTSLLEAIESARLCTQVMRNWGYPQHMREIIRELLKPLESEIAARVGVGPMAFLVLTDRLCRKSCERASKFMESIGDALRQTDLRKMVNSFCTAAGSSKVDAARVLKVIKSRAGSREDHRLFLLSYFHQVLPSLFVFTIEDCATLVPSDTDVSRLQAALDELSFEFGDLASENPEHLMMQSTIRTRPLIRIGKGRYFLPIHGLFNSFFLEIVEAWIKPHTDLKARYHRRRATFLEVTLERMLKQAFPGCLVRTGTMWTDVHDSKDYENDCLVVCGPVALVLEAKSERVDDAARRGGAKTLRDHYDTLVNAPAKQAARFARLLEDGQGLIRFRTKNGADYELNLSDIRRAVCISVTLDSFPAATLCWQHLVKSGLVHPEDRPAVNLSLTDLMVGLEVLQSPVTRLHYFWRRIEWEEQVTYVGDEGDILVYYLSNGLLIPKADDPTATPHMYLYGTSVQLHRFYMAKWVDPETSTPPPQRILTPWWASLIRAMEALQETSRWEIACVLLDFSFEQQQQFERRFEEVLQLVRQHGNDCAENALITFGHETESDAAIVGFAYRGLSTNERNSRAANLAAQAQQESSVKRVVIIGRDVERLEDAYDFVGFVGE